MSDNTTTPDGTNPWAAALSAGPIRDEHGRFVYDPSYNPDDGDKYDADPHLAGGPDDVDDL